jgi:hypothetical protein
MKITNRSLQGSYGKKLLLLTFDYELFLGDKSGTARRCLIDPTDKLLACLNKYAFKAIFFVDTVYLLRLEEKATEYPSARADLEAITSQLTSMVKCGHEIHPHIHPHWMDASYDPEVNEWCLSDKTHYTFASVPEVLRTELFDHSVGFIRSILDQANRTQFLDAYRAGGWSIQPFEHFRPHFLRHGIKHEFSVIPGRYCYSDAHRYDFRNAPADMPVYPFGRDTCAYDEHGGFTEWTISCLPMTKPQRWFDFKISGLVHRLPITKERGGSVIRTNITEEGDLYSNDKMTRLLASFEGLNPYRITMYADLIKRANYFHFISHPKLLNGLELKMMDTLFSLLGRSSRLETDFRMQSWHD